MLTVQRLDRKMLWLLNSAIACFQCIFYYSFPVDPSTYLLALFSCLRSSSCLLSFHHKSAKGSLQSIIFSFLNWLAEMQLGSTRTPLKAGQTALHRLHSTTKHPCLRRHASPTQQPASFFPHWPNILFTEKNTVRIVHSKGHCNLNKALQNTVNKITRKNHSKCAAIY